MNEINIEIILIIAPKIIISLNGNLECFTKPIIAISTKVKKLFFS